MKNLRPFVIVTLLIAAVFSSYGAPTLQAGPIRYGKQINLKVTDTKLRDVIVLIARFAKFNILVGKTVTGKVTVELTNVDCLKVLEILAKMNGYKYAIRDDIICIGDEKAIRSVRGRGIASVMTLRFADGAAMAGIVKKLDKDLEVIHDKRTNTLIVAPK